MKRHSIICRLGSADRAKIDVAVQDSTITTLNFLHDDGALKFGLSNALDALAHIGAAPREAAVEVAILGALVFCADTRISRDKHSQDGWTREIDLYMPVCDIKSWKKASGSLIKALNFLTGDKWRLFVRPRTKGSSKLVEPVQTQFHGLTCASLFSGGLDSFIGAIDLLKSGARPLLVSHHADSVTAKHQRICLQRLAEKFGETWKSVDAYVSFKTATVENGGEESTQRSRSFLFFALGVLSASAIGKRTTLYVPENGLIALNVPLDPLRLGALSTRTTHPFFMKRFEDGIHSLGIEVDLENPYRHSTKGEMARACKDRAFLKARLKDTMSCSSPTKGRWKKEASGHCGYCVPCIIRRASVTAAFDKDETFYALKDLASASNHSDKAIGANIRSFLLSIRRLSANPAAAKVLIHSSGPLTEFRAEWDAYAKMYTRGIAEVAALFNLGEQPKA